MYNPHVLVDRDGTLIKEKHYLCDPEQVELIDGAAQGLQRLQLLGLGVILITNQSGIGRGYFSREQFEQVHCRLSDLLKNAGVCLDGIYLCPHAPWENCTCRKPKPGLAYKAAAEHDFDLRDCFVIGDRTCDIELGRSVEATSFLVRTGYGRKEEKDMRGMPDYVVDSLVDAVPIIHALHKRGVGSE